MSWVFPEDVDGWLSEAEGRALSVFASGKDVLEIGSYCGKSTICMAQTAKHVWCVDPFDGRGTPNPRGTADEWLDNTTRYLGHQIGNPKAEAFVGPADECCEQLQRDGKSFDFIFIDGAHDLDNVRNDLEWAVTLLRPNGHIALHDYRSGLDVENKDAEVDRAVDEFIADGAEVVWRSGSVVVLRPPRHLIEENYNAPRVFLAMPHNGTMYSSAARAMFKHATRRGTYRFELDMESSVLTLNFNRLWVEALNCDADYFVMLHDDVMPDGWWVDSLMDEIQRFDADVVSAVVPIKSKEGLTSTALGDAGNPWRPMRRLTMREACELPLTFSRDDIDIEGGPHLYINTGCWIANLRKPWVEKNVFRNHHRIVRATLEDGTIRRKADCITEDWAFSMDLVRWGAKVMATRAVGLAHEHKDWHNRSAWGTWATDEEYLDRIAKAPQVHREPALATA